MPDMYRCRALSHVRTNEAELAHCGQVTGVYRPDGEASR